MDKNIDESMLAAELLMLYDDFVEYQDYCAFWGDALTSLTKDTGELDPCTAMGISRFSQQIKQRTASLAQALKRIQQMSARLEEQVKSGSEGTK